LGRPVSTTCALYVNADPADISSESIVEQLVMDRISQTMTLYSADHTVAAAEAGKTLAAYIATGGTGASVPEPASVSVLALVSAAAAAAAALGRRRRRFERIALQYRRCGVYPQESL
jgi:hypothetical protein